MARARLYGAGAAAPRPSDAWQLAVRALDAVAGGSMPSAGRAARGGVMSRQPYSPHDRGRLQGGGGHGGTARPLLLGAAMPSVVDAIACTIADRRNGGSAGAARRPAAARHRTRGGRAHTCGAEAKAHRTRGRGQRDPVRRPRMAGSIKPHVPRRALGGGGNRAPRPRRIRASSLCRFLRPSRAMRAAATGSRQRRERRRRQNAAPGTQVRPASLSRWHGRAPEAARRVAFHSE